MKSIDPFWSCPECGEPSARVLSGYTTSSDYLVEVGTPFCDHHWVVRGAEIPYIEWEDA